MCIVYLADNLHEMSTYFLWKKKKKNIYIYIYIEMLSAALVIGALHVKISEHLIWVYTVCQACLSNYSKAIFNLNIHTDMPVQKSVDPDKTASKQRTVETCVFTTF